MTKPNPHAAALGRAGGSVTSAAKAAAARENGKRGGRPRNVTTPTVRYEGRIPATLRAWVERHAADKLAEIHHGGGFNTTSGMAYDVMTAAGWRVTYPDVLHNVIEPTVRDVIDALKTLEPCDCANCQIALNRS